MSIFTALRNRGPPPPRPYHPRATVWTVEPFTATATSDRSELIMTIKQHHRERIDRDLAGPWRIMPPWSTSGWGVCIVTSGKQIIARLPGRNKQRRSAVARMLICTPELMDFARTVAADPDAPEYLVHEAECLLRQATGEPY